MAKIYQVEYIDEATSKKDIVDKVNEWLALNSDKVADLKEIAFKTEWKEKRDGETYLSGTFHCAEITYETTPEKL